MKITIACLGILIGQISLADDQCKAPPLSILLTNDDGVGTVGIKEMHRALIDAGHHVKRIAPNQNYSGSGASLTRGGVTVEDLSTDEFPNVYAVSGSPATSVILGATAIFDPDEPLDLVVSGINEGANVGPAPTISGTVGAVLTGLNLLHPSVPGVAISTNPLSKQGESPENQEHYANVARFVTRIIGVVGCDNPSLLSSKQALHINYPPLASDDIKGVRLAKQGNRGPRRIAYVGNGDGTYDARYVANEAGGDTESADTTFFYDGYVTIVPIDGEYTAIPRFDIKQVLLVDP
jgi:5'/3'-nucleotidase SurE